MFLRAIRDRVLASKAVTLTTMVFVAAAATLVALAAILVVDLSGAIDTLMTRAKTPHVMQMHAGDLDRERLAAFAEAPNDVAKFQVLQHGSGHGASLCSERQPEAHGDPDPPREVNGTPCSSAPSRMSSRNVLPRPHSLVEGQFNRPSQQSQHTLRLAPS